MVVRVKAFWIVVGCTVGAIIGATIDAAFLPTNPDWVDTVTSGGGAIFGGLATSRLSGNAH